MAPLCTTQYTELPNLLEEQRELMQHGNFTMLYIHEFFSHQFTKKTQRNEKFKSWSGTIFKKSGFQEDYKNLTKSLYVLIWINWEISSNFVAFSENLNFIEICFWDIFVNWMIVSYWAKFGISYLHQLTQCFKSVKNLIFSQWLVM